MTATARRPRGWAAAHPLDALGANGDDPHDVGQPPAWRAWSTARNADDAPHATCMRLGNHDVVAGGWLVFVRVMLGA